MIELKRFYEVEIGDTIIMEGAIGWKISEFGFICEDCLASKIQYNKELLKAGGTILADPFSDPCIKIKIREEVCQLVSHL